MIHQRWYHEAEWWVNCVYDNPKGEEKTLLLNVVSLKYSTKRSGSDTLYIALKSLASQQRNSTIFQANGWKKIGSGWLVSRGSFNKRSFAKIALFLCFAVWSDVQKFSVCLGPPPKSKQWSMQGKTAREFLWCPKAENKDFLMPVLPHQTHQQKRARSFANFQTQAGKKYIPIAQKQCELHNAL